MIHLVPRLASIIHLVSLVAYYLTRGCILDVLLILDVLVYCTMRTVHVCIYPVATTITVDSIHLRNLLLAVGGRATGNVDDGVSDRRLAQ